MIGPAAGLLGFIAMLRFALFWRQRRLLLRQRQLPTMSAACDAALQRAHELLRAELGRVFVAIVLLVLVATSAHYGIDGAALPIAMALTTYLAEIVIVPAAKAAGMRARSGLLLVGAVLAGAVALLAAWSIGSLGWPIGLILTLLTSTVALGTFQLCDWLWMRPHREPRGLIPDGRLLQRMQTLGRQCGVADVQFYVVEGDTRTINARAESDPRGRRVVLWPALLQRLDPADLDAVVTHELGHLALRHLRTRFLNVAMLLSISLLATSLIAAYAWTPSRGRAGLQVATIAVLLPLIFSCLRARLLSVFRRQEIEADSFVVDKGRGRALADALLRLSPSMVATPESDVWHRWAYDSHPPTGLRLIHLRGPGRVT